MQLYALSVVEGVPNPDQTNGVIKDGVRDPFHRCLNLPAKPVSGPG